MVTNYLAMNDSYVEQFHDKIDQELARRKVELSQIRELVYSFEHETGVAIDARIRGATTLLYAHWEGSIRSIAERYLRYVAKQNLPYKELTINFLAIAVKGMTLETAKSSKISAYSKYLCEVLECFDLTLPRFSTVINTQSNLNAEVFSEILATVGIDSSAIEVDAMLIDNKLLGVRNKIAHGEFYDGLAHGKEEYIKIHDRIVSLIDAFAQEVKNAALHKSYLASNNPSCWVPSRMTLLLPPLNAYWQNKL